MHAEPRLTPETSPTPLRQILLLAGLALALSWGVVCWIPPAPSAAVTGRLAAASEPVVAERGGRVVEWLVGEGTVVEPGQPLLRIDEPRRASLIERRRQEIAGLQAALEKAQADAQLELAWRTRSIETELHETRLKTAGLMQVRFDRELEHRAWQDLTAGTVLADATSPAAGRPGPRLSSGRASTDDGHALAVLRAETARNAVEVAATQVALCEQRLRELERLRQTLPALVDRAADVARLTEQLASAEGEWAALERTARDAIVTAPAHGRVGTFRHREGAAVTAGDEVVRLFDDRRRSIVAAVPARHVPRFAAGDAVVVVFPGDERRTGRIEPVPPQTAPTPGRPSAEAVVELRITPTGQPWPQAALGSTVQVVPRH